jgi:predicted nucleic acid-binding protein
MFDTSGLVKYYHTEVGSNKVQQFADDPKNRICISDLSIVEFVSSLAKKVRMGEFAATAFRTARRRFFADIVAGKFHIVMLTQKHGRTAVKLLVKHATKRSLRTLDALQLAIAVDLQSQRMLDYFVCADIKFGKVVKLEKVNFLNPEIP